MKSCVALLCWFSAFLTACNAHRSFSLPSIQNRAGLAVVVLLNNNGTPQTIGPTQTLAQWFAGPSTLQSSQQALTPALWVFELESLVPALETHCAQLPHALDREACLQRVARCETEAASCLQLALSPQDCGTRAVVDAKPSAIYTWDNNRSRALTTTEQQTALTRVVRCGPIIHEPCSPYASRVVVESELGTCVAPVQQQGCTLQLELSACGFANLEVPIRNNKAVLPSHAATLTLGTPLLGTPGCPRQGPAQYNAHADAGGFIAGALLWPTSNTPDLLLYGTGRDDCALSGCSKRGQNCEGLCAYDCIEEVRLRDCITDNWATCTGESGSDQCFQRCKRYCQNTTTQHCEGLNGLSLTHTRINTPEFDHWHFSLTSSIADHQPALGPQALLLQNDTQLLTATRRALMPVDLVAPRTLQPLRLPMNIAGLLHFDTEHILVYGDCNNQGCLAFVGWDSASVLHANTPLSRHNTSLPLRRIEGAHVWSNHNTRNLWLWGPIHNNHDSSAVLMSFHNSQAPYDNPTLAEPMQGHHHVVQLNEQTLLSILRVDAQNEVAVLSRMSETDNGLHFTQVLQLPLWPGRSITNLQPAQHPERTVWITSTDVHGSAPAHIGTLTWSADHQQLARSPDLIPSNTRHITQLLENSAGTALFVIDAHTNRMFNIALEP